MLRRFLDRYDEPDCFDDWGDDPSFFSAVDILGSADEATWGKATQLQVHHRWPIEAHYHIRDTTFSEDTAASRTGSGPANLATIRVAIIAAIKDAGYLHVPEGRRDHTTPAETLHLHGLD